MRLQHVTQVILRYRRGRRQIVVGATRLPVGSMQGCPIWLGQLHDIVLEREGRLMQPAYMQRLVQRKPVARAQRSRLHDLVAGIGVTGELVLGRDLEQSAADDDAENTRRG